MTTINTRTTGPQAWKIALVAAAASLATLVVVNLPISTDTVTGQPATEATQAVPDQATVDLLAPVITQETLDGSSVGPQAVPDQATIDGLTPAITQEFLDTNAAVTGIDGGTRVDPRAAAAAGLNPGAVDEIVGGTTSSAVADQATIDGLTPVISQEFLDGRTPADGTAGAATDARWEALAYAYESGTISTYYTGELDPTVGVNARLEALAQANESGTISTYYTGGPDSDVATVARWEALADAYENETISSFYLPAAAGEEPHVPTANNQIR